MSTLYMTTDPVTGKRVAVPLAVASAFNGIEDSSKISPVYDPATRTLTVTYSAGAAVWVGGARFVKSGVETATHVHLQGKHYFYYNSSGVLTFSSTVWDLQQTAPLVAVYYTSTTLVGIAYDERHPAMSGMDNATHAYLHRTRGTQAVSGFVASGYTLNTAGAAALAYSISSGVIADEDLYTNISTLAAGGPYRIFSRTLGRWVWSDTSTTGILDNGTDIYYDLLGSGLTAIATNNRWVNYYVIAFPELTGTNRIGVVVGQTVYTSAATALAEDPATAIASLSDLTEEFVYLYRMTYRRVSGSSPSNAQLVGVQAIRTNTTSITSGFNPSDHQSLSGRDSTAAHPATAIALDVTSFGRILTGTEVNTQLALQKLNDSAATMPIPEEFVSTGQTTFALATDITDNDKIKFFIDGRLMREGASYAWTRNSAANQIVATETVPTGKWCYIEIIKG